MRVLGQAAGKSNELGLQNLAQQSRMARSEQDWPDIVRGHLEQVVGSGRDEIDEAMARANDLGAVRDQRKPQLYPRSMLANIPTNALVRWPVADDLLAVLVLDLPQAVARERGPFHAALLQVGLSARLRKTFEEVALVAAVLDETNRGVVRVRLRLEPLGREVAPHHQKRAQRHAVADDDEVADVLLEVALDGG